VEVLLDSLRALEMSFGDLWTPDIASGKLTRPYQHLEECAVLCCAGGVPGRLVPRAGAADRPEADLANDGLYCYEGHLRPACPRVPRARLKLEAAH